MALSNKQRAFIEAYLANGFNATKAAIAAGYAESSARVQGHRLITNANISALAAERIRAMAMTADEALARLSEHGRGDMGDFAHVSTAADLQKHPQSRLVKKIKRTIHYEELPAGFIEERIEVELYDAQSAQLAILKEQHLRAGEATERIDGMKLKAYIGFSPDEWDDEPGT